MITLLELADRCEKVSGPDREIDREIGRAIGIHVQGSPQEPTAWINREWIPLPVYTASIDAAMTLIPDSWHVVQLRHMNPTNWYAEVGSIIDDAETREGEGIFGNLALCAASLRARHATLEVVKVRA